MKDWLFKNDDPISGPLEFTDEDPEFCRAEKLKFPKNPVKYARPNITANMRADMINDPNVDTFLLIGI